LLPQIRNFFINATFATKTVLKTQGGKDENNTYLYSEPNV